MKHLLSLEQIWCAVLLSNFFKKCCFPQFFLLIHTLLIHLNVWLLKLSQMFTRKSLILIRWGDEDIHNSLLNFFNKTERCIVLCEVIVHVTHVRILLKWKFDSVQIQDGVWDLLVSQPASWFRDHLMWRIIIVSCGFQSNMPIKITL